MNDFPCLLADLRPLNFCSFNWILDSFLLYHNIPPQKSGDAFTTIISRFLSYHILVCLKNQPHVSVKFSSVIHLTVDNYYLRGFGLISISVSLWQVFPWGKKKLHKRLYALPGIPAYSFSFCALPAPRLCAWLYPSFCSSSH